MTETNEAKIVVITEVMLAEQTYLSEHFKVGDETTEDRINELAQQYAQGQANTENATPEGDTATGEEETGATQGE